jgi:hypothetical protein
MRAERLVAGVADAEALASGLDSFVPWTDWGALVKDVALD